MRQVVLAAVAFGLAACGSNADAARKAFEYVASCPADRVVVEEREPSNVAMLPPDDVANDPARLELWKRKEEERRARVAAQRDYVARGCGQERTFHCKWGGYLGPKCWVVDGSPPAVPSASP